MIDEPGFKKIILAPMPPRDLEWAEAKINTAYGPVSSRWQQKGYLIEYEFQIPANTSALLELPALGKKITSIKESSVVLYQDGKFQPADHIELQDVQDEKTSYLLGAGKYKFAVEYK